MEMGERGCLCSVEDSALKLLVRRYSGLLWKGQGCSGPLFSFMACKSGASLCYSRTGCWRVAAAEAASPKQHLLLITK